MACTCEGWNRRTFLTFAVGGTAGMALAPWARLLGQETASRARAKSCILLWMGGGPSQLDTWDPKPGQKTGGEFKAVETAVRGMRISEHLPRLAEQSRHFSIIRTLTTMEAAHERGTYLMHTGYAPIAGLPFAPLGTVVSHELSRQDFPLPTFVALAPPDVPQSAIFGDAHLPFAVRDVNNPIPNLRSLVDAGRDRERAELLQAQDASFEEGRGGREMERRGEAAKKAQELMTTPLLKAFEVNREPDAVRKAYGGGFGQNCLLARRLVEAGVPFVEVGLGGWDTHDNNFDQVRRLSEQLDAGMGTLVKELAERDLLSHTMVLWAGEFGRTPMITESNGRDHWTRCWSVVLGGGGIPGGRVVGETDKQGMDIASRPVPVQDFFATVYSAMGIDPEKKYVLSGRQVRYAFNGKPIKELT